jgi:hypothetical protein
MNIRLYPTVYKLFGRDVEIVYQDVHENNRMNVKIQLVRITTITTGVIPNDPVDISEDQQKILTHAVDRILTENLGYCLIDRNELYISSGRTYPKSWFNTVLGYIQIPTEYNPFIKKDGIYLTFNPKSDYKTAYNETVKTLLDTLDKYYHDGVVYGADEISVPWKLERLDYEEVRPKLYKPTWTDQRFAPLPVEFLLGKIQKDPYIRIKVSDNLVSRHKIAQTLSEEGINMIYSGNYIKIPVNNLDDAQYVTSTVISALDTAEGKVATYAVNRIEWVHMYIDAANKLLDNPDCTGYQTSDPEKPYIFSCLVDRNISISSVLSELKTMVLIKLAESGVKK